MPFKSRADRNEYQREYYKTVLKPRQDNEPKSFIKRDISIRKPLNFITPSNLTDDRFLEGGVIGPKIYKLGYGLSSDTDDSESEPDDDETIQEKNERLLTEFLKMLIDFKNPDRIKVWTKAKLNPKMERMYNKNTDFKQYVKMCLCKGLYPNAPPDCDDNENSEDDDE